MAESDVQPHPGAEEEDITPRSDFWQGAGWVVFGIAVLVGSITMDRLESQNINPYTIPGLLPGVLGLAMILLGAVLAVRSYQRGAFTEAPEPFTPHQREVRKRVWTVIAICIVYSVGLIGQGLPFWLGSAIFIVASILILQRMDHDPERRRFTRKLWLQALVVGIAASVITQLVFQEVFLVRLP
jgi:hypothetical protein